MVPKYSILLYGKPLEEYKPQITARLSASIKVIWFGGEDEIDWLNRTYPLFARELLLLTYPAHSPGKRSSLTAGTGRTFSTCWKSSAPASTLPSTRWSTASSRSTLSVREKPRAWWTASSI